MSGVAKAVGSVASGIAPWASKIPGLGSIAGGLLGAGGSLLQGGGFSGMLSGALSGVNPLAGMLPTFAQGIGGFGQAGNVTGDPQAGVGPTNNDSMLSKLWGFVKDPQNLALLGLGGLGAYGLNKSGILDPRLMNDPRNNTSNTFSQILQQALGGQTGQILSSGQLPTYGGPFAAGTDPSQTGAMGGLQDIINQITGSNQGQNILGTLTGMSQQGNQLTLPPEIQALLGQGNQGNSILGNIGSGSDPISQMIAQMGANNPALSQLLSFQSNSPERQLLLNAGSQDVTGGGQNLVGQGAGLLQQLASSPQLQQLLSGGQGADIGQIGQMLTNASNPGLQDNIAQLREQFSFNGLRNSTDLNQGVSNLMARNQAGIQGALAGIIPQLTQGANQTALGAGGLLQNIGSQFGNLGQAAGNLGLGQQQNVLNAFGTAGNLGQGSAGQTLQALTSAGNLSLGGGNLLQSLLGTQAGAAQGMNAGSNQQLDILSQLFGGQQQRALGAATAAPGAYTSIMSLLPQILQQQFGQGQTLQQNAQAGIQNQIGAFNQGNSLYPLLLQYLGGTPGPTYGPSLLSQLGGILTQGAVAKQLK